VGIWELMERERVMSNLQQRIYEAERRLYEAAQQIEKEQQQQAEESPAARLAAAERELEALHREQELAGWNWAKSQNAGIEYDNRKSREALIAALEDLDLKAAQIEASIVVKTAEAQRDLIATAVNSYPAGLEPGQTPYARHDSDTAGKLALGGLISQFVACWSLVLTLDNYVHNGPSDHPQHVRAGLAYALLPRDYFTKRHPFDAAQKAGQELKDDLLHSAGYMPK